MFDRLKTSSGLSLIELIVTMTILGILASVVLPLTRMTAQRTKEVELRLRLRMIRTAIDDYYKMFNKMPAGPLKTGSGYPKDLDDLVNGRNFGNINGNVKFLRHKLYDPFGPTPDPSDPVWGWNARSLADLPTSSTWGGQDVFDVYSKSNEPALDGKTIYSDW